MRRGRVMGGAATAMLVTAAVVVLLLLGGEDRGTAAAAEVGGSIGTVERRTLTERLTASGTIGYAAETTVPARLSGTVTALPAPGDLVRRGEPLYALDGEPVLLMYGAVPAYRTLAEGVGDGEDVEQLERNLGALGYEPGAIDEVFTAATAVAIGAWQEDLGLELSREVELGRVAFLPGPQRVIGPEAMLGEALAGGSGGETESEPPSHPVLRTSSTRRIVSVDLGADQQTIARRGQRVGVVLPGGAEVPGEVRRLAAVDPADGEDGQGEEAEAGVEATISLLGGHRIPALDGAAVSVRFIQRLREDVLSVPLTALLAIGGGRFAVVAEESGKRRRLEVRPGLAADGYVEVAGEGLRPGLRVEVAG